MQTTAANDSSFSCALPTDFLRPVSPPLGCWMYHGSRDAKGLGGSDNNPGFCADLCFAADAYGYFIMDMDGERGKPENDWGWCTCLRNPDTDLVAEYPVGTFQTCSLSSTPRATRLVCTD